MTPVVVVVVGRRLDHEVRWMWYTVSRRRKKKKEGRPRWVWGRRCKVAHVVPPPSPLPLPPLRFRISSPPKAKRRRRTTREPSTFFVPLPSAIAMGRQVALDKLVIQVPRHIQIRVPFLLLPRHLRNGLSTRGMPLPLPPYRTLMPKALEVR